MPAPYYYHSLVLRSKDITHHHRTCQAGQAGQARPILHEYTTMVLYCVKNDVHVDQSALFPYYTDTGLKIDPRFPALWLDRVGSCAGSAFDDTRTKNLLGHPEQAAICTMHNAK